ncbi:MAG: hybrid sensor histidine kinase/response regulator [Vicinamibacterales bacterium]
MKDEFLAAVSHELRTPLNAIMGWTQILKSTSPNEQTMQRAIASLARNAEAQSRVIEDLLDISRIITGKLQLAMKEVDLRAVIETAADVIEPMSRSRGVAIQLSLPTVPCIVQGDYDRLRQILWNLLSNALKFTPSGGRVEVQLELAAESFTIVVRDTGVGMDPAFLSHAFERFRQADGTTTREQGGLGLGLAIVKELTELHGGTVRAESAGLGQGATFRVTIPRAPVTRLGEAHAAPPNQQLPSLRGLRVMVVDDNADALEVLGHALERAGAEVRLERSADAAVAEWPAWPTDVLLCDLAMPGLDGFELLRRIRAIDAAAGRSTPALAVTAYASEDYRIRCLRAGFAGHVAKPYNIADIVRAVAAAAAPN